MLTRSVALLWAIACVGCAEETIVRSAPPNAQVWINDKFIGVTPVRWKFARSEWPQDNFFRYRATREGYRDKVGEVRGHPTPGRIIGGAFTLGILFIFKRPVTVPDPLDIELIPVGSPRAERSATNTRSVEERLNQLDELYEHGAINQHEHLRRRREILDEL